MFEGGRRSSRLQTWSPNEEGKLFVEEMQREIELRKETEQFAEMEMRKKLRSRTPKDFRWKSYNEGDQSRCWKRCLDPSLAMVPKHGLFKK